MPAKRSTLLIARETNVTWPLHHTIRLRPLLCSMAVLSLCVFESCFLFRSEPKVQAPDPALLQPQIAMSEEYVRSKPGDLLAFLPKGWFLVDVESKMSSDIVAVAVNPEYTVSMVVQNLRSDDQLRETVRSEGLIGLARSAFERRMRKTANGVRLLSPMDKLSYGSKNFGSYEFSIDAVDSTAQRARSVVLISALDNYYEVALVPTPVTTAKPPEEDEMRKIFHSILVRLQF